MRQLGKNDHPIRLGFIGVFLTLSYLAILVPWGFLEGARLHSYDTYCRWRNAIQVPPTQLNNLLLVTIDEESQKHLGRKWPWDRSLFAQLINQLGASDPKLIMMDLVLSGESEPIHDQALAQAIREGPPTLLASYLDRNGNPVLPLPLFTEAGASTGLINKPRDVDLTVRRLWAAMRMPMRSNPLYAIEVHSTAILHDIPAEEIKLGRSLRIGSRQVPLEPPGAMNINYLASPEQIPTVSFWQIIQNQVADAQIRDRVVLVGSATEITHDIYPTSLGLMPGVAISANGLLTLFTERYPQAIPFPLVLLLGFAFSYGILMITYRLTLGRGLATALGILAFGVALGFALVLFLDLKVESLSIFILCSSAWLVGALYKYGLLMAATVRLHRQVATEPTSGAFTSRYFRLRMEDLWPTEKRRPQSLLIVRTERVSDLVQKIPWEEAQDKLQNFVSTIERLKPRGAQVGQLVDGQYGVFLPNMRFKAAMRWGERLRGELPPISDQIAMGLASTDQAPIGSSKELIRCAEAAMTRSGIKGANTLEPFSPELDKVSLGGPTKDAHQKEGSQLDYIASELEERNRALEKALVDLRETHKEMANHFLEVTKSLVLALETKDEYTTGHLERVSRYATRLAEVLQLPAEEVEAVREAALLHDIGKISIPDETLHKVGALTDQEKEDIKKHFAIGAKILEPMKFFKPITTIIYHHHERFDGKGYPHGLTGEFIPPGAQIISVVDSFDAMTTNRGYNKPLSVKEALEELKKCAGTQFNPVFVEKFAHIIEKEGPQLAGHQAPP